MFGRRCAAVAFSSLALIGASAVWGPAGQATEDKHRGVVCTGPSESTYDPPLTLQARQTHVHTDARYTCTVADDRTVAATGSLDGVSPASSCVSLTSPHLKETVQYADGKRSLIVYDSGSSVRVAGVLIVRLSGEVTEGRGKGQSARRDVQLALPDQLPTECLSSGLQGSNGEARLEIRP
jgi:hypothetical protein